MNKIARTLTGLALVSALFSTGTALAAIKCWTNHEGVRECGNAIPPEFAQQETRTINDRGITLDVKERAKTGAELKAEQQRQQLEQERAAEAKRQQELQAKGDRVLLDTFASEQDIVMARDRKVTALEGTVDLTNSSLPKQQQKVDEFRKRIAALESSGQPVPADLKEDMAVEQQKLDNKLAFISAKRAEITAIRAEYEGYLTRYRELQQRRQ